MIDRKAKSRKVPAYVKAEVKARVLEAKARRARLDARYKLGRLDGSQKWQAERILRSYDDDGVLHTVPADATSPDPSTPVESGPSAATL